MYDDSRYTYTHSHSKKSFNHLEWKFARLLASYVTQQCAFINPIKWMTHQRFTWKQIYHVFTYSRWCNVNDSHRQTSSLFALFWWYSKKKKISTLIALISKNFLKFSVYMKSPSIESFAVSICHWSFLCDVKGRKSIKYLYSSHIAIIQMRITFLLRARLMVLIEMSHFTSKENNVDIFMKAKGVVMQVNSSKSSFFNKLWKLLFFKFCAEFSSAMF